MHITRIIDYTIDSHWSFLPRSPSVLKVETHILSTPQSPSARRRHRIYRFTLSRAYTGILSPNSVHSHTGIVFLGLFARPKLLGKLAFTGVFSAWTHRHGDACSCYPALYPILQHFSFVSKPRTFFIHAIYLNTNYH